MDRHDIEGATAKSVADAHHKDLKLQDKYGVKMLTYWFTDMKDSTAITTRLGDARALELFRTHNALTRDKLSHFHGTEIQHTGDGFMVSFTSASNAVGCGIGIQQAFAMHNESHPNTPIQLRIGMCAGEPVEEDQRLFGATVQLASRICDQADPDQILVASAIRDLCLGKPFHFCDRGESVLKGFEQPQRIYEVEWRKV
jgi:adenylate cyclase